VRIANLGGAAEGGAEAGLARGAQVSLSFSKFAPAGDNLIVAATPVASAH
jgi:hypothetical protein